MHARNDDISGGGGGVDNTERTRQHQKTRSASKPRLAAHDDTSIPTCTIGARRRNLHSRRRQKRRPSRLLSIRAAIVARGASAVAGAIRGAIFCASADTILVDDALFPNKPSICPLTLLVAVFLL